MVLSAGAEETFEKCRKASNDGIERMRTIASEAFSDDNRFIIGVNGSYARREVTSGSDIDLFVLSVGDNKPNDFIDNQRKFREALKDEGFKMPATDGVFSVPLSVSMTRDMIGGMDDKNIHITRRMLLLLEGEYLFNQEAFYEARKVLLEQYLSKELRDEQICLFLLNDVIRYWRTICVDFEFKVRNDGKPRAIRLIKLRFSRMMLFVAGVLAIGETYEQPAKEKAKTLSKFLAIPACDRFYKITGEKGEAALELYASFLQALDDKNVREKLSQPSPLGEESDEFMTLRGKAHEFRDELFTLLTHHYSKAHPMLAALTL